jgi:hypothetical protein
MTMCGGLRPRVTTAAREGGYGKGIQLREDPQQVDASRLPDQREVAISGEFPIASASVFDASSGQVNGAIPPIKLCRPISRRSRISLPPT